ncbi:MAG: replication protein RepA [Bryobacteraceae bacterium]
MQTFALPLFKTLDLSLSDVSNCESRVSDEFFREVTTHSIPTDLEAAKALSSAPAALDLFMWLSYRCFTAKGQERIPIFGDFGLAAQLGSEAAIGQPHK